MHQLRKAYVFSVFLCAMFVTSCGGGNRVLTAITISPNPAVAKNGKSTTGSYRDVQCATVYGDAAGCELVAKPL